jgi:hypothetical protein
MIFLDGTERAMNIRTRLQAFAGSLAAKLRVREARIGVGFTVAETSADGFTHCGQSISLTSLLQHG